MSQSQCGRSSSQTGYGSQALVSRYLTNYLIRRGPIPGRQVFLPKEISGISRSFPRLSRTPGQVPTRYSPVRRSPRRGALDLHVLSAPPAFVLSQDQTLSFIPASLAKKSRTHDTTPKPESPKGSAAIETHQRCTKQPPPPAHPLQIHK